MIIAGIDVDWHHWDEVATAIVPVIILLLFAVTVVQARLLRAQVKQGQDGVAQAARAAAAAERAVTEATRARIDARASHVVAFIKKPRWIPYLNRVRVTDPWGRPIPLDPSNRERINPEMQFSFPLNSEMFLWFDNELTLTNEGLTTAQVQIGHEGVQLSDTFQGANDGSRQPLGGGQRSDIYALPPGQTMHLDWRTGRTLQEWKLAYEEPDPPNPLGACLAGVIIVDDDQDGILDNITFMLAGTPIEPVHGQNGQWHLVRDLAKMATVVNRRRRYRVDGMLPVYTSSEFEGQFNAWEALAQKQERTRP